MSSISPIRPPLAAIPREFETNFFGTLVVTRAVADVLGRNGGGAVINTLSVLSRFSWTKPRRTRRKRRSGA